MKFHSGMAIKKILEVYSIPISPELPSSFLTEPLITWGTLYFEYGSNPSSLEKKLICYFASERFLKDAKVATKELSLRGTYPQNLYWLTLLYDNDGNICIQGDMDMKIP